MGESDIASSFRYYRCLWELRPDASVTAFAIIPDGVNLFPECCRTGCQVAFMSALVVCDMT